MINNLLFRMRHFFLVTFFSLIIVSCGCSFTVANDVASGIFIRKDVPIEAIKEIRIQKLTRQQYVSASKLGKVPDLPYVSITDLREINTVYEILDSAVEQGAHEAGEECYYMVAFIANNNGDGLVLLNNKDYLSILSKKLTRRNGYPCDQCYQKLSVIHNNKVIINGAESD